MKNKWEKIVRIMCRMEKNKNRIIEWGNVKIGFVQKKGMSK